jgi:putative oxidoreductase
MSTTVSQGRTSAVPQATQRRGRVIALWVLQVLLAVSFASGGLLKLGGAHQMVDLFTKIGAGQWFRYLIGTFEIAGAAGVLIPALSGLAALGLSGLMVGASITNAFIIHTSPMVLLAFLAVSTLVAWGRWPQTKALPGKLRR